MVDPFHNRIQGIALVAVLALAHAGCGSSRAGTDPAPPLLEGGEGGGVDATIPSDAAMHAPAPDGNPAVDADRTTDAGGTLDAGDATDAQAADAGEAGVQFDTDAAAPCTGVQVHAPSGLTNALVASYPAGTTFCLNAGTYAMAGSVLASSNDTFIGVGTVILDFGATPYSALAGQAGQTFGLYGFATAQSGVTVQNLVVQNCNPHHQSASNDACVAVKEGADWIVQDVEVRYSDEGVGGGCDHCFVHHNYTYGFVDFSGQSPSDPTRITSSEIAFNGGTPDPGGSTGASKTTHLSYAVWDNDDVHDNLGPGFWCDGCWLGSQTLVQNSVFTNNQGPAIDWEISWGACPAPLGCPNGTAMPFIGSGFAIARYNTLTNNDTVNLGQSCYWSAQIQVQNSEGIEVYGNTIDSRSGVNAVCAIDTTRADSWPTYPESIEPFSFHDNTVHLATTALVGEAGMEFTHEAAPGHVWFDANTYHEASLTEQHWEWLAATNVTFADWQGDGQDPSSTTSLSP